MQHEAGARSHEAGQRWTGDAWNLSGDSRRNGERFCRLDLARRETSASGIPGPGSCRPFGEINDRFVNQYYRKYCKDPNSKHWQDWPYFAADGAVLAVDGYFRILGRVDDVINVAGHRLGTKEIESACLTVPEVAEAAVVPVVDEIKGRVPEVYIALQPGIRGQPGDYGEG